MNKRGLLLIVTVLPFVVSCSQVNSSAKPKKIEGFPKEMVGVWDAQVGYSEGERWGLKFEEDGSVSRIVHNVAGPIVIEKGGIEGNGPAPDTYYMFVLGVTSVEYNLFSKKVTAEINIDSYEMKLPQGTLKGKIRDTFTGAVSKDGQTWTVEWRNYGWLEGAQDPDIKYIDKNPEIITFKKLDLSKLPTVSQPIEKK